MRGNSEVELSEVEHPRADSNQGSERQEACFKMQLPCEEGNAKLVFMIEVAWFSD